MGALDQLTEREVFGLLVRGLSNAGWLGPDPSQPASLRCLASW